MKTIHMLFKHFVILCCAFVATSAFGQATVTWNGAGDGVNITDTTNWTGGALPVPNNGDMAQFDGVVPGDLNLIYYGGLAGAWNDTASLTWQLTANQTGSVTITTPSATSAYLNMGNIDVAAGAGALTFGGTDPAHRLLLVARPLSYNHTFVNNSTNPATFNPQIQWGSQGGAYWTADFSGTGDWMVNNYMVNNNGGDNLIQVDGPGTVYWNPSGFLGVNSIGTPIVINGGALVLEGPHPRLAGQQIGMNTGTRFEFNAPGKSQTLSGDITGFGDVMVSGGTLTLSSATSDYGGNTILNGGVLVVNGVQTPGGTGPIGGGGSYGNGTISFTGGTLKYSLANVYDYSGRFSTADNQAFSIDTAGLDVTYTNAAGLASTGGTLTKLGAGTLTLEGPSAYSGLTTVAAGNLVFQGSKTGSGDITVDDGAAVGITDTGTPVTPATLTVGSSSGATLGFYNVNSTTTAPLAAGTVSANGPITVNVISGSFVTGQSYPLFSWTSGSAPAVKLGILNSAIGNLSTNGNKIQLNITGLSFVWTGTTSGTWDTSAQNWTFNGSPTAFTNGYPAFFDDSAAGTTDVTPSGVVTPASVSFYNNSKAYSVTSSAGNNIGGSGSLSKSGTGTVTLSGGANTYTGATTVGQGTLSVSSLANGGAASDIGQSSSDAANLVLNGGTLQYTGSGASSDRSFTVGLANGTVDASGTAALALSAASLGYSGNGPRTLTLAGTSTGNSLAAMIADNGGATTLTKSGTGAWALTGDNTYSGETMILGGLLQIGTGGATGALGSGDVVNNGIIDFNRTGTLTVDGAITGSGSVTNDGSGTVILAGNNGYTGGTYINAGTLQVGNGGATGTIYNNGAIVNNGTLVFDSTSDIIIDQFNGVISGTGNVIVRGSGLVDCSAANTYAGWTLIEPGATFQPFSNNQGQLASSVVTNNGTFFVTCQEYAPAIRGYTNNIVGTGRLVKENNNQNAGTMWLSGANTYTGGTWIAGGGIQIGDGITPGAGSIVGDVIFTNSAGGFFTNPRFLVFDRPDNFTFTNNIMSVATQGTALEQGEVDQYATNYTVRLTGNHNSYPGFTQIFGGTLQVGDGGTSGTIGSGNVNIVDPTYSFFAFDRSDNVTLSNVITGAGSFVKLGTGTLTLPADCTYSGTTVVSNGMLRVNGANAAGYTFVFSGGGLGGSGTLAGQVTMSPGTTLAAGASASAIGTLTINNSLDIGGDVAIKVNTSLAQPNDLVVVSGSLNNSGTGTLTVTNLGPALAPGTKFTLFSQPVANGSALTVVGGRPGVTWTNNLATDGSITVLTASPAAPTLNITRTNGGNSLQFSWTGSGYKLQSQTNSLSVGLSTNWVDYPGGGTSGVTVPIGATSGAVFFRLVSTP